MTMFHLSVGSTLDQDAASSSSESLHFMMEQERTTYSCCDFVCDGSDSEDDSSSSDSICSSSSTIHPQGFTNNDKVMPADRKKMTNWCYAIVDRCQFQRETVAITMNIVDRFVSAPRASSAGSKKAEAAYGRTKYQLVTITALYIAIKLNERTIFGSRDFAAASRGMHSLEDIEGMELEILHTLSWRLCPPTSLQVADQILSLMLSQDARIKIEAGTLDLLQEEVAFQTENAVRDHYFATQLPSTISAAAIMNAIESVCDQDFEYLTEALICVIGRFPFEPHAVLLGARNHLLRLANEEEVEENDESEGNGAPTPEKE